MGKRKHRDKDSHILNKIRRLEKRLCRRDSSDTSDSGSEFRHRRYYSRSSSRYRSRSASAEHIDLSDSQESSNSHIKSTVCAVHPETTTTQDTSASTSSSDPKPTESQPAPDPSATATDKTTTSLPDDILEALGDPKGKDEVFGPKIPDEIAERWGRVLVDGLTKELKQERMEKTLVPDNFRLVKAPLLNQEIASVLSDSVRNRDKLLEKAQNHLGLGIAGLTSLTSSVIQGNLDKIDLLKKISEISQIFLDLHHENTKTRRKLVITSLDKKFINMIGDVKRDNFLFGANLGDKIKASKTAERSGLQIKRNDGAASTSSSRKNTSQQGNWRGPPRASGQRAHRPGGPRSRYYKQNNKRSQPNPGRSAPAAKTNNNTKTNQQ